MKITTGQSAKMARHWFYAYFGQNRQTRWRILRPLIVGATSMMFIVGGASCSAQPDRSTGAHQLPSAHDSEAPTPIALAASDGDTALVKKLLEEKSGRLADQSFGAKMTLLAVAASQGHADTVSFLLRAGINPNIPDQSGATALSFAALSSGSAETVEILLKGGANPNAPNIQGDTPLHYAATSGRLEIARLIVAAGGDPAIKDLKGQTPGDIAKSDGFPDLAAYLRSAEHRRPAPPATQPR